MTRREQLQRVAKDWNETIRASQVIPIYPMSEDLLPGDVFLVQTTIDTQQSVWSQAGYLPLDTHVVRLHPRGYGEFYRNSFFEPGQTPTLPRDWAKEVNAGKSDEWSLAPGAAFPSYEFTVSSSAGLNAAFPISGVPVGVSLLGAKAAHGSVLISDARTYGVDLASMYEELKVWAASHQGLLEAWGGDPEAEARDRRPNYLRVVTRVYLTGAMTVSIQDTRSASGGLDVGAARPVDLLFAKPGDDTDRITLEQLEANQGALNKMLGSAKDNVQGSGAESLIPGGSLRVAAASSRAITMEETFDPPIVLGYLGFDVEVRPGGLLGPPVPTHALLQGDEGAAENLRGSLAAEIILSSRADLARFADFRRQLSDSDRERIDEELVRIGLEVPGHVQALSMVSTTVKLQRRPSNGDFPSSTVGLFQWLSALGGSKQEADRWLQALADGVSVQGEGELSGWEREDIVAERTRLEEEFSAVVAQLNSSPVIPRILKKAALRPLLGGD